MVLLRFKMIDLISDTHLDFFKDREQVNQLLNGLVSNSDTLVIAGDFCEINHDSYFEYLRILCDKYLNVIYVFGNHEWYDITFDNGETHKKVKKLANRDNLYLLQNEAIIALVNGIETEFVCASGFFPDSRKARENKLLLNDFRYINDYEPFVSNLETRIFFEDYLKRKKTTRNRIVVTHHLPSYKSIPRQFLAEDRTNCYYNSGLFQRDYNIDYWLHGHTHDQFDYLEDLDDGQKCRVVCNPTGYHCAPVIKAIELS